MMTINAAERRPSLAELSCPRDCPKRNAWCHSSCKQHDEYRAEAERLRRERFENQVTFTPAMLRNLNKQSRF